VQPYKVTYMYVCALQRNAMQDPINCFVSRLVRRKKQAMGGT